jgi:hypothetical protein
MGFQPTDDSQHIYLTKQIILEPEDYLILLFMVAKAAVFFERLFDEPGFTNVVILV